MDEMKEVSKLGYQIMSRGVVVRGGGVVVVIGVVLVLILVGVIDEEPSGHHCHCCLKLSCFGVCVWRYVVKL